MRTRALGALLTAAATTAALISPVAAAPVQAAGGRVLGLGLPGAIPGRYIVTLRDGTTGAAPAGDRDGALSALLHGDQDGALGAVLHGDPDGALSALLHGDQDGALGAVLGGDRGAGRVVARAGATMAAVMTPAQASRLAADPAVRYVEQDRRVHIAAATQRQPDWGLDRIDQRRATGSGTYRPMDDGDSVHAYVIDTGVRISHAEFGGRASYGYDFVDGDPVAADCNGHGTHVAGTIGGTRYGVAKKVRIVAVRVLDCSGEGDLYDVIAGVNWVTSHAVRPAVANMSMGGDHSASLEAAVQKSISAGITYVVAAGNDDVDAARESPAGLSAAITVGATDRRDRRASFSDYGRVLDLFAPGVDIRSAWAAGDTATAVLSGTSMAAPHVAGAAALVLDAFPGDTPAQVRDYLVAKATTGRVTGTHGSPDRLLYVPAPPGPPAIVTTRVSASLLRPVAGKVSLASTRRGFWSIVSGTLPAGLRLSAGGTLSGTPTTPGTRTVVLRFVDYVPNTVTRSVTFTVARTTPAIVPAPLPPGTAGGDYAAQIAVADDRAGSWAVTGGALPDGLALSAGGLLGGVPAAAGDATFTVRFTDLWGDTTARTYSLTVGPASN